MTGATALLRNEPVQARSTARLSSLLDAAAAAIDAVGIERLTTAMVAERAGASIGTVYRYFPDRIAVLQAVAARAVDRYTERVGKIAESTDYATWWDLFDALIDEGVHAFSNEPGFSSLRFGDTLDIRPREGDRAGSSRVTDVIVPTLVTRFGLPKDTVAFHLDVLFTLVDSLLARAFTVNRKGDQAFIAEARNVARSYLVSVYGEPSAR